MLPPRERLLLLYATAPEDFAATYAELRHKFALIPRRKIYSAVRYLVGQGLLERSREGFKAGPALREELDAGV